jgi:hypothetical protein
MDKNFKHMISEEDAKVVIEFDEEQNRKGNFDLIFPLPSNTKYYGELFE